MKTAIIMSKEEAMALPLKKRPICFRISSELYHEIFLKVGYASMCWNPKPSSEAFDAEKASSAAVDICFAAAEESEKGKKDALLSAIEEFNRIDGYEGREPDPQRVWTLSQIKQILRSEAAKYHNI